MKGPPIPAALSKLADQLRRLGKGDDLIVLLVNLAILIAMSCFALSIPFGATPTGKTLRARGLGILLAMALLAFLIQLIVAYVAAIGHWSLHHPFTTVITVIVVSTIAYFARQLRHPPEQRPRRVATMQPYTHRRRDEDILSAIRDQLREGDDG